MSRPNLVLALAAGALTFSSLSSAPVSAQTQTQTQSGGAPVERYGNLSSLPAANSGPASRPQASRWVAIITFTKWVDPRESAFAVNVPQGWQIGGGLVRHSAVSSNPVVRAQSPDGKVQVLVGDPNVLPATVPNQLYAYAGIREGQSTQDPSGRPVVMGRYPTVEHER